MFLVIQTVSLAFPTSSIYSCITTVVLIGEVALKLNLSCPCCYISETLFNQTSDFHIPACHTSKISIISKKCVDLKYIVCSELWKLKHNELHNIFHVINFFFLFKCLTGLQFKCTINTHTHTRTNFKIKLPFPPALRTCFVCQ